MVHLRIKLYWRAASFAEYHFSPVGCYVILLTYIRKMTQQCTGEKWYTLLDLVARQYSLHETSHMNVAHYSVLGVVTVCFWIRTLTS